MEPTLTPTGDNKKAPKIAKEKRVGTGSAEATELGQELDLELKIEENPVKALMDFETSKEWLAFLPYMKEPTSEPREKVKSEALKALDLIESNLDQSDENYERYKKLVENYKESLTRNSGNA